jgi:hypothetical protein
MLSVVANVLNLFNAEGRRWTMAEKYEESFERADRVDGNGPKFSHARAHKEKRELQFGDLASLSRWCAWRWCAWRQEGRENKDGSKRLTKVPYSPHGGAFRSWRKLRVREDRGRPRFVRWEPFPSRRVKPMVRGTGEPSAQIATATSSEPTPRPGAVPAIPLTAHRSDGTSESRK